MWTWRDLFACSFALLIVAGCSGRPARIPAPTVDPESAVNRALELYDKNGDGRLDKDELALCPGVRDMLSLYDQDGDGIVDRAEFVGRLSDLLKSRIGLTQLRARVTFQGKPLSGAKVVLEPEPYLGEEVLAAEGTTDAYGAAQLGIPQQNLPESVRNMRLVHCGTFKVRITHPSIKIPGKYNTQTTLGYETRLGDPFAKFALTVQ